MKSHAAALMTAVLLMAGVAGCSANEMPDTAYSVVYQDESFLQEMTALMEAYFQAIEDTDHMAMMNCTTDSFFWNYDETGFTEYSRYIEKAELKGLDTENMIEKEGIYMVRVSYTLTYGSPFTDENGVSQSSGSYEKSTEFSVIRTEDGLRIIDSDDRVKG